MDEEREKEQERLEDQVYRIILLTAIAITAIFLSCTYFVKPLNLYHVQVEQTVSAPAPVRSEKPESSETTVRLPEKQSVDLNTATPEELDALPGIGPMLAEAIVRYREENGGFLDIEELQEVSGIGEKTFEKLKEYIVVNK